MSRNLFIALVLAAVAQSLTFFQGQSQFIWTWAKNNPIIISFMGIPISYLFIMFVKYAALSFNGEIWPGRLIGFAVGAIVFTILASVIMKEPVSLKTFICLILSAGILGIQMFWK